MKKAILIVSFGTTYPGTRQKNITAIREQVQALYPDVLIEEAVSSTIVRKAMRTREDIEAKSPAEGLEALKAKGATNVVVLPTHIIDGIENHRMKQVVQEYAQDFASIAVADALLATEEDYENVAKALWESLKDEVGDAPLILMGHGTEHAADGSYEIFETAIRNYSDHEIYIATVEGAVTIEDVIVRMQKKHASSTNKKMNNQRVVVTPFMLVAGDHANKDMAGGMQEAEDGEPEEDSFAGKLQTAGYAPDCIIRGIGEYPAIREIYMAHLRSKTSEVFSANNACDCENTVHQPEKGMLYGIGVGPGNPKLITLQALETIQKCDVIVLPAVSKEECYAYQIVKKVCQEIDEKALLCMPFPMIRDEKKLALAHERIYQAIEDYLMQGQTVGLLTIGDPSVYSTYIYMHKRAIKEGWSAEIISGVPSFCAVAARLGIPLGEKEEEIHIIPGSYEVQNTLQYQGTRVYMKSGKKLQELLEILRMQEKQDGKTLEVYGVSNCGMDNEKVYRGLSELEAAKGYLTTVIVKGNCDETTEG